MNLQEGFRRIGVATYWIAIPLGILVVVATGDLLLAVLVFLAVLVVAVGLLHLAAYIIKGFMKQGDEAQNRE